MEVIGSICIAAITGAFISFVAYEWILCRKRTLAEILKLKAEARFFDAMTAELEAYHE